MIGKDKKEEIVSQARTAMSAAQAVFIAENRGMTAAEMATLQRNVRAGGGRAQVMKNTLAKLALKDSPFAALSDSLSGPLVFGIAPDAAAVAKAFSTAAKAHEHFIIRGGILSQGAMLDAGEIGRLANIPPREQLLAQLMGMMRAPTGTFVRTLNEVPARFVRVLAAVRDKQEGGDSN